jgi:hypothetical protein
VTFSQQAPGQMGLASMTDADIARQALGFADDLRTDFSERDRIYNLIDNVIFL